MNASYRPSPEFEELLAQMCDGDLTQAESRRLEEIVTLNDDDCAYYLRHIHLHGTLYWNIAQPTGVFAFPMKDKEDGSKGRGEGSESNPQPMNPNPSFVPPIIIDPSPSLHSPVGSFIFSHIAAAVILAIGLIIGLAWRISLPSSERPTQDDQSIAQAVGRITALADCQWQKTRSGGRGPRSGISEIQIPKSPNPQIPVFLGDRLVLTSGLMQITYDTGAHVLLQGPCTFQIDSVRSGYLAVGKLTALVEKGAGARGPGSGNANHSPLSPLPSPLFAVRTPTAVVTDLGTEFGVEVEQSGATRSHVFQGTIELRASNSRRLTTSGEPVEILQAGQSARVERGPNQKASITRETNQFNRFVREINTSTNRQFSKSSSSSLIPHPSPFAYRLTDLGALDGKTSRAFGINSRGEVVGDAATAGGSRHAVLYSHGKIKDLGAFLGGNSCAFGINSKGHVVGGYSDNLGRHAFLNIDGAIKDLGNLGGKDAQACAINDAGTVVGWSQDEQGVRRAFLYVDRHGMKSLGALGGPAAMSWAHDINANGTVVGWSADREGQMRAFLYSDALGIRDLGMFGGIRSGAFRVNNAELVLGLSSTTAGVRQVFLHDSKTNETNRWTVDRRPNLVVDINNAGQMIAGVANCDSKHPGAYLFEQGQWFNLNQLLDRTTGWTLLTVSAINDSGQIVGNGQAPDGGMRAFLLTPVNKKGVRD